jgi:hypothetical protein
MGWGQYALPFHLLFPPLDPFLQHYPRLLPAVCIASIVVEERLDAALYLNSCGLPT